MGLIVLTLGRGGAGTHRADGDRQPSGATPFDANAATEDGALRALLEALGTPVGNADMQIASIALQAISLSSRELARLMCVGSFSP